MVLKCINSNIGEKYMRTITIRTTNGDTIKSEMHYTENVMECIMNVLLNYGYTYAYLRDYSIS